MADLDLSPELISCLWWLCQLPWPVAIVAGVWEAFRADAESRAIEAQRRQERTRALALAEEAQREARARRREVLMRSHSGMVSIPPVPALREVRDPTVRGHKRSA